jgi:hypothetical protein
MMAVEQSRRGANQLAFSRSNLAKTARMCARSLGVQTGLFFGIDRVQALL